MLLPIAKKPAIDLVKSKKETALSKYAIVVLISAMSYNGDMLPPATTKKPKTSNACARTQTQGAPLFLALVKYFQNKILRSDPMAYKFQLL